MTAALHDNCLEQTFTYFEKTAPPLVQKRKRVKAISRQLLRAFLLLSGALRRGAVTVPFFVIA
jgi:hypothetical protein